jgi:hypothetical protein
MIGGQSLRLIRMSTRSVMPHPEPLTAGFSHPYYDCYCSKVSPCYCSLFCCCYCCATGSGIPLHRGSLQPPTGYRLMQCSLVSSVWAVILMLRCLVEASQKVVVVGRTPASLDGCGRQLFSFHPMLCLVVLTYQPCTPDTTCTYICCFVCLIR